MDINGLLGHIQKLWTKLDNEDKIGHYGPRLTKIDKLYIIWTQFDTGQNRTL